MVHIRWTHEKQDGIALAIIEPPGCGKTTMLQHVALTLADKKQKQHGLKSQTPLFLFLREHVHLILEHDPSLADLAQFYFPNSTLLYHKVAIKSQ